MCQFTRAEFLTGCRALKADNCRAIQARLPELAERVRVEEELFRELYRFTYKVGTVITDKETDPTYYLSFQFGLDTSSGQRILPVEMAVSLWLLVFSQNEPPILKKWLHFLEKHPQVRRLNGVNCINSLYSLSGARDTPRHLEHVS